MLGQTMGWQTGLSVLGFLVTMWSVYPAFVNLAEVHRISVGKSIAIGAIVMAPIIVLAFGAGIIMGISNIQAH